jgi:hypothetical protein
MGQHVWLLLATVLTELLVIVKWSTGQYPAPFPKPVKVGLWTLGLGVVVVYPMYQVGCLSACVEGGGELRARDGAFSVVSEFGIVPMAACSPLSYGSSVVLLPVFLELSLSVRQRAPRRHSFVLLLFFPTPFSHSCETKH